MPEIHRPYLDRFPDRWSRGTVLWPPARAIRGSTGCYDSLQARREKLRGRPALLLWEMRDPAFRPHQLARRREALPGARVVELPDAGHWPREEAPERVTAERRRVLGGDRPGREPEDGQAFVRRIGRATGPATGGR